MHKQRRKKLEALIIGKKQLWSDNDSSEMIESFFLWLQNRIKETQCLSSNNK